MASRPKIKMEPEAVDACFQVPAVKRRVYK